MKDIKQVAIIIIFILALALPLLNKAYYIDDTAFLYIANQIEKDPLRPYSFHIEWGSTSGSASYLRDTPLIPYYVALISKLFGRSEIVLHFSFLIFPIMAGISFYFISKKFVKFPLAATLIMLATPTFLANSQNLMLDVPALSLFLLAAALYINGVDKENNPNLFFGSIAAGFAYLAKPNAIVIIPLLMLYCFLNKKSKYMVYMLVPVVFIILFAVHNYFFEDRILIADYLPFLINNKGSNFDKAPAYFFSNLSYIGGATIFTLFLVYPFILRKRNLIILSFSALLSTLASIFLYNFSSHFVSGRYTISQIVLFFAFILSSTFFIMIVIVENYKGIKLALQNIFCLKKINYDVDNFFIISWFMGVFILNSFISGGAVRYNTLFLPPLVLSYFVTLKKYADQLRINLSRLLLIALLLTVLTGIIVAYADYDYANSYRDFALNVPQKYKTENNAIWFTGSDGFQYYMETKGYKIIPRNGNPYKKGDIIIKAMLPNPRKISQELANRIKLIETVTYDGKIPVRTQNPQAHAGFYTYGAGFLPYSFSGSKLETFEIYYVQN